MSEPVDYALHSGRIMAIAQEIAAAHFRKRLDVEFKDDESPVTQADKAIERAVRAYLETHFPDHGIWGEEQGAQGLGNRALWVIDPIDGTRSFLSGHPLFGFLLAHVTDGTPDMGLVGMPALGETYLGLPGKGATLNGAQISVSKTERLDRAILYVNEGDKIYDRCPEAFARLMQAGRTRRFGYDCYPHALLAAGHVDAVVDFDLKPYDFLAVSALVEAAGGLMTDWTGAPLGLTSDGAVVSAATAPLHRELVALLGAGG